jgi:hypothetical protein
LRTKPFPLWKGPGHRKKEMQMQIKKVEKKEVKDGYVQIDFIVQHCGSTRSIKGFFELEGRDLDWEGSFENWEPGFEGWEIQMKFDEEVWKNEDVIKILEAEVKKLQTA